MLSITRTTFNTFKTTLRGKGANLTLQERSLTFRQVKTFAQVHNIALTFEVGLTPVFLALLTLSPIETMVWWYICLVLGMPGAAGLFVCMRPYLLFQGDLNGPKAGKTLKTTSNWP